MDRLAAKMGKLRVAHSPNKQSKSKSKSPEGPSLNRHTNKVMSNPKKDFIVMGKIQSGKTSFILKTTGKLLKQGNHVLIMLRNSINDLEQLKGRMNPKMLYDNKLHITLGSASRIDKTLKELETKGVKSITLIVDEADMVFKKADAKFNKSYKKLQEITTQTIYVSATNITTLFKVDMDNIIVLPVSPDYIGLDKIKIDTSFKSEFEPYKVIFKKKRSLVLHKTTRTKDIQIDKAKIISELKSGVICCVFNSDGYTLIKDGKIIRNIDKKTRLSKVITMLTDKYNHVVFVSGNIASRGLSFVSEDYSKHLTDEILIMSKSSRSDTLVQGLRLLGIFKDKKKPTLYTSKAIQDEIHKYIELQDRLIKYNPKKKREVYYDTSIEREDLPTRGVIYAGIEKLRISKDKDRKKLKLKNVDEKIKPKKEGGHEKNF